MVDIEEMVYSSPLISSAQINELNTVCMTDPTHYLSLMMGYTLQVFTPFRINIGTSNPNLKVIVLCSSQAIATNLGIKSSYAFSPSSKLYKVISTAESVSNLLISHTCGSLNLNLSTTYIYNDFEHLLQLVSKRLGLVNSNGQTITGSVSAPTQVNSLAV